MLTVVLGGARAGKTSAAIRLAERSEVVTRDARAVTYIATSPRLDAELDARIERHRAERPDHWVTIEEELDLAAALERSGETVTIVDCLTLWVNNLMHHGCDEREVLERSQLAIGAAARRPADTIVISNEVGAGIVPANELARRYRDAIGRVNQQWVAAADRALFMVAGRAITLGALNGDDGIAGTAP
jgi:adenosyl cobinamide kinase/adenosyl cobinamide phosphate guanylyltransferase